VHYVYILRCADGTLYTGYTPDLKARIVVHNAGRGAKYTRGRRPVTLVYSKRFRSIGKALTCEHSIKQLSRTQKEALIAARRPLKQRV
jgi:putative endonuclease